MLSGRKSKTDPIIEAINREIALVHQAADNLEAYFDINHDDKPDALANISPILEAEINALNALDDEMHEKGGVDDDNKVLSKTFNRDNSHKVHKDRLAKIEEILTKHNIKPVPEKVKTYINVALEAHDKIVALYQPKPVAPIKTDAKFFEEITELEKEICTFVPEDEKAGYELHFKNQQAALKKAFDMLQNEVDSKKIETYLTKLAAECQSKVTQINEASAKAHEGILLKHFTAIRDQIKIHKEQRAKKVTPGSITPKSQYGRLPGTADTGITTTTFDVTPVTLKDFANLLLEAIEVENTIVKDKFPKELIEKNLQAIADFINKLTNDSKTADKINTLKSEITGLYGQLKNKTSGYAALLPATEKALNAYQTKMDAKFKLLTSKVSAAAVVAPGTLTAAELYTKYQEKIQKLKDLQLSIEANHPKTFTLFNPFDDGKAMRERTERHLRMLIDLPTSPQLREKIADIKNDSKTFLDNELQKYKATSLEAKARLEKFLKTSAKAIKLMEDLSKFHFLQNTTTSEIVKFDADKTEKEIKEIFIKEAESLGIGTGSGALAEEAVLAGNEIPRFTDKLEDGQMRVLAINTTNDTKVAVAEIMRKGTFRSVIYDATIAYSIDKLLQKICSENGVPADSIVNICDAIKNEYSKKMILKESTINDILQKQKNISPETAEKVASKFYDEHMLRNFQEFKGYNLPSEELTRLAIGLVNSMIATRPKETININKAPSAAFANAVVLVCKAHGYPVSNNSTFKCVKPTQGEVQEFTNMMLSRNLGAGQFATAAGHMHQANKLRRHTM